MSLLASSVMLTWLDKIPGFSASGCFMSRGKQSWNGPCKLTGAAFKYFHERTNEGGLVGVHGARE